MNGNIKISCIIPTRNRNGFLQEAVDSVLKQIRQPDEIIIINNGNNDIILPENIKSKIKVFNYNKKASASAARNYGAKMASGNYLAFLDDDDLWNIKYLENVLAAIENGVECIISRLDRLFKNGEVKNFKNADGKLTINNLLVYNPGVTGSNIVIKKSIFNKLGGFDENLITSEDKSLIIEALKENIKITVLPKNQVLSRMSDLNSSLANSAEKMAEGVSSFTKKYKNIMSLRQYIINLLKINKYRYESGKKISYVSYVILYFFNLPFKLINKNYGRK